jgi:hypothetical protein
MMPDEDARTDDAGKGTEDKNQSNAGDQFPFVHLVVLKSQQGRHFRRLDIIDHELINIGCRQ